MFSPQQPHPPPQYTDVELGSVPLSSKLAHEKTGSTLSGLDTYQDWHAGAPHDPHHNGPSQDQNNTRSKPHRRYLHLLLYSTLCIFALILITGLAVHFTRRHRQNNSSSVTVNLDNNNDLPSSVSVSVITIYTSRDGSTTKELYTMTLPPATATNELPVLFPSLTVGTVTEVVAQMPGRTVTRVRTTEVTVQAGSPLAPTPTASITGRPDQGTVDPVAASIFREFVEGSGVTILGGP